MWKVLIASVALTAPTPGTAATGIWKGCTIDSVVVCASAACSPRKPAISIFVSDYMDAGAERGAYYRCKPGLKDCDRYSASVYRTGEFIIFSVPGQSAFAKLGTDDRITDVAAIGDSVLVSRGRCAERAPPPSK